VSIILAISVYGAVRGYRYNDQARGWRSGVSWFDVRQGQVLFRFESIHTVSEAYSDSQPKSTGSNSRVGKVTGASSWPLISN